MALLTALVVGPNGAGKIADLDAALAAASGGGDTYQASGKDVLFIENTDGSPHTVTIPSVANNFGNVVTANDITQVVAAGKFAVIGPIDPSKYADASGIVHVNYSAATGMKVGVRTFATTS